MRVVGSDGADVGTVKEVRANDFLINRPMKRDIYAPFDAIRGVNDTVMLNIPADDVDNTDWPKPALMGGAKDDDKGTVDDRTGVADRDVDRDRDRDRAGDGDVLNP